MKERINIAELLKKCCVRTWLYCPMFGNCLLSAASTDEDSLYPIKIVSPNDDLVLKFSNDGTLFCVEKRDTYFNNYGNECLLFPSSDYRSWKGVKVKNGKLVIPEVKPTYGKYYCFGDFPEKAKEINAEFAKYGARNVVDFTEYYTSTLYYIDNLGYIIPVLESIENVEQELIAQGYKQLPYKYHPKDKELVWCWYDEFFASRTLEFYNAKNHCCFTPNGKRKGAPYSNYAPYEGEYPDWAKEALKKLEE